MPIIHIRHHQQVTLTVTSEPPSFFFPFVSFANPFRPSGRCSARAIALILSASCLPTLSWIHPTFIPSHSPEHYIDLMAMSMTCPLPPPKKSTLIRWGSLSPKQLEASAFVSLFLFCFSFLYWGSIGYSKLGEWLFVCVCPTERKWRPVEGVALPVA